MERKAILATLMVCGMFGLTGCGDDDESTDGAGGAAGAAASGGAAGATQNGDGGSGGAGVTMELNDGEILHVVETANSGEVEQGEVASERAQNADVVSFAEAMVTEHTRALEQGEMLETEEGITPANNPMSQMLKTESDAIVATLEASPEEQFDLLYMDAQVQVHQKVLDTLDRDLIPQAEDEQLLEYLTELRAHVATHLESAETIVEQLQ